MKIIIGLITFIVLICSVHADFVIKQQVEGTAQNGIIITKIKDDKTRKDMPSNRLGEISIIQDLKTGDTTTMIHDRKAARIELGSQIIQKLNAANVGITIPKLTDTDKIEKVGDYAAEVYTWTNSDGSNETIWVAKNYPDYAKIKVQLAKLNQSPVAQLRRRTSIDFSNLPGMVVKTKSESSLGEIMTILISAKEENVDVSDFQIPADYRVIHASN